MLPLSTQNKRRGCREKKNDCWLLMALGAMRDRAMKRLSNVLLHHENEAERNERVFVTPRSIVPRWFYYEVEKSLIISLLNSCVSKVICGYINSNWTYCVLSVCVEQTHFIFIAKISNSWTKHCLQHRPKVVEAVLAYNEFELRLTASIIYDSALYIF